MYEFISPNSSIIILLVVSSSIVIDKLFLKAIMVEVLSTCYFLIIVPDVDSIMLLESISLTICKLLFCATICVVVPLLSIDDVFVFNNISLLGIIKL